MADSTADVPLSQWWEQEYLNCTRNPLEQPVPLVEIAYHYDISRIGACTERALFLSGIETIEFGRLTPDFVGPFDGVHAAEPRPVEDPVVSRRQFSVRWNPRRLHFELRRDAAASRAVFLRFPERLSERVVLPANERVVLPVGSYVEVDGRLLLYFDHRPWVDAEFDRMGMIGECAPMWKLREAIAAVAKENARVVFVGGPSGSGKELVARALHAASPRASYPFLAVNLGASESGPVEVQLFGSTAGAFTNAVCKKGCFEEVGRGTVFLDEVAELAPGTQVKLLRSLENYEIVPVGGRPRTFQACVISASHCSLEEAVEKEKLRFDFAMRLDRIRLELPSLAQRQADIARLFRFFFFKHAKPEGPDALTGAARLWRRVATAQPAISLEQLVEVLEAPWTGQVRQLQNFVERLVAMNQGSSGPVRWPSLPRWSSEPESGPGLRRVTPTSKELGRAQLEQVLHQQRWSVSQSAQALGLSTRELQALMARHGLQISRELLQALLEELATHQRLADFLGVSRNTLYAWMDKVGMQR
ncbi:MAG: sigma 54-interacting transcriptional regulator [Myxococcota bacterium]|nr:sigma 54-interacting transcriptional regulator [Myxococcota bacterium]